MSLDDIKETFFAECADQMAELETGLHEIQSSGPDIDTVNAVFRAVHSIKGGAGAFGFAALVSFAHVFENALDVIRNDLNQVNEDRMDLLLRSVDVLSDVIEAERTGSEPDDTSGLANDLETAFGLAEAAEDADDGDDALADFAPVMIDLADLGVAGTPAGGSFHISFAPHASLYLKGHDPLRFFRELADLGTLSVTCDTTDLPKLSELSPDESYLKWQIDLETESAREDIEAIFDWVDGECALSIEETGAPAADDGASLDAFLQSLDESDGGIADIDDFGRDPEMEPADAANPVADLIGSLEAADIGAPARQVEEQADAGNSDDGSEDAGARAGKKEVKKASQTIRVESEKVDRLINLMGELVINQAMLAERIGQAGFGNASPAALALVELQNLTREIQSGVMAIRAQPVKPVFMRMSRIIREVCSATGKKAMLELEGEHTEVDTTVIEGLIDPLTHMIRNAVDHGIEDPEKRQAKGKPTHGTVKLSAYHSSGRIVIEIKDDGAGINRERVLSKAIEKGIVARDAKLSDDDIDNLIFAPGFSTAETITDVSGRGVGMDVVRQSIQALGGRVNISSEPGHGSLFSMSLPLTLAVLDGMIVKEAGQTLVLPVSAVLETATLKPGDVYTIGKNNRVVKMRNQLIPIIDVGRQLGFADKRTDFTKGTIMVVEGGKNGMGAFLVDSIEGQQQVVIKSLESNYKRVPSIAAATILGNGQIALILDCDHIVSHQASDPDTAVIQSMAG
ncbi:MAG: chemotaxis protein CheA [Ahrensia sp.]|nr:chemotaxis protein CheA [Ahrensia sp.]|tara:strand:+ start:41210 stop:43435 length:2226 start_codon:yes stop_codon:yes gene_type:complete